MVKVFVIAVTLAIVAAGCASSGELVEVDSSQQPAPAETQASIGGGQEGATPIPVEPGGGIGDGTGGANIPIVSPDLTLEVDQALADLGGRLGDDRLIGVAVAHELTWPDGSLGCPEPGVEYTQALIDGYRIELIDGDTVYQYHGAAGQAPFLCESVVN